MYPGLLAAILILSTLVLGAIITYVGYTSYRRHLLKGDPRAQRADAIELCNFTLVPNSVPSSIPSRPVSRAPRVPPKARLSSTGSMRYSLRESQLSLGGSSIYSTTPGPSSGPSGESSGTLRRHGEPPASTAGRSTYDDDDEDAWTDVDMYSQSAVTAFDFGFGDESFEREKRRSRPETALQGHGLSLM